MNQPRMDGCMNWDDLKIFLAVAEAPSMRVAAKNLKVSHSTVSRRIETLEADLEVRLFDRMPDGYQLTDAGRELMPIALNTDENLNTFGRHVAGRDDELKGQVCVTMPDAAAKSLLMPHLQDFMTEYPDIQIKVNDSFELFDLSRREADVAIRFTNSPPEHLIGRKIGTVYQAVYATREYLEQHNPERPDSTAKWVAWGTPDERPSWIKKSPFPHLGVAGHFNNVILQYEAVKSHMGLGYFPCMLVTDESLVRLSEPVSEPQYDVWLLSHRDLRAAARMRSFRQFVIDRIPIFKAALEGRQFESGEASA
ncbi:MAG: LysR family transcriptional regulator [Kordiimonas sp.]